MDAKTLYSKQKRRLLYIFTIRQWRSRIEKRKIQIQEIWSAIARFFFPSCAYYIVWDRERIEFVLHFNNCFSLFDNQFRLVTCSIFLSQSFSSILFFVWSVVCKMKFLSKKQQHNNNRIATIKKRSHMFTTSIRSKSQKRHFLCVHSSLDTIFLEWSFRNVWHNLFCVMQFFLSRYTRSFDNPTLIRAIILHSK